MAVVKITKSQLKQIIKEELEEATSPPPSTDRPFAAVYKILVFQNRDISWSGTKVYNVLGEIFSSLPNQEEAWKITAELFAAADWSALDPID
jgi:hypothetical protein